MELVNKQKEIWKDIKGYEGLYQISDYGRVKSLPFIITKLMRNKSSHLRSKKKEIIMRANEKVYARVKLCKKGVGKKYSVHRLVALHFLKNPHNYKYVNHKDQNKLNNHYLNLEFCNTRENTSYSIDKSKTSSQYTGVYLKKRNRSNPWGSDISINGKKEHLGYYPTEIEAHNAYLDALNRHGLNNKYAANV